MKDMIFQIPGIIIRDKSIGHGKRQFVIETQESLDSELLQRLIVLENQLGYFTFAVRQIEAEDLINLPKFDKTKYDIGKSPSSRLRNVLFLVHKQKGGKKEDFEIFYMNAIERLIDHYKNQLDK
jgi:hypothetical protein